VDERFVTIPSQLKDSIEEDIKAVAWARGKSVIDGIDPSYSGKFAHVKKMITDTGLQILDYQFLRR
jgi:hypothetical protein